MSTITLWKGYGMARPCWVDALPDWVTEVEYQSSPHGYEVTMHHGCSTCFVFVPCVAPTDMDPDAYTLGELLDLGKHMVGFTKSELGVPAGE